MECGRDGHCRSCGDHSVPPWTCPQQWEGAPCFVGLAPPRPLPSARSQTLSRHQGNRPQETGSQAPGRTRGKIGRVGESFGGAWEASLDLGSSSRHSSVPWKVGEFLLVKPFLASLTSLEGLSVPSLLPGSSVTPVLPSQENPRLPLPPSSPTGFSGDIKVVCSSWMNLTWYPRESVFLSPG